MRNRKKLVQAVREEADGYIYPRRKEFQEELSDEIKAAVPAEHLQEFMTVLTSMVVNP